MAINNTVTNSFLGGISKKPTNAFLGNYKQNAGTNSFLSGIKAPSQSTVQGAIKPPTFNAPTQPVAQATSPAPQPFNANAGGVIPPPQKMTTPSGMPIAGNPATFNGGQSPQQEAPKKGLFSSVADSLATFDPFKNPTVSDAYSKAQELNKALAESKRNEAGGTATLLRQAIPLGDQEGQARVLQDQYLKQQNALAEEMSGQASLYGAGFTGTGQQQSALTSLGGLAPDATRFETFGGGGLAPQQRATELAQQVKSGLMSPKDAEAQMNSLYGGAGATFLNQALQGGGFNYNTATAQSAAQQSNVQQQGTALTDIARSGLQQATQEYNDDFAQAQSATQGAGRVKYILEKTGLNNTASTDYNKALNEVSRRFSGEDINALQTALNEAQTFYGALLQSRGGTPTGNELISRNVLDMSKSAKAINASIAELDAAVATMLQSSKGKMDTYQQALQGGQGGGNTGGNSYTSPSGKTYSLPN